MLFNGQYPLPPPYAAKTHIQREGERERGREGVRGGEREEGERGREGEGGGERERGEHALPTAMTRE